MQKDDEILRIVPLIIFFILLFWLSEKEVAIFRTCACRIACNPCSIFILWLQAVAFEANHPRFWFVRTWGEVLELEKS
ncbi:MAG TPA: hypothetical protein DEO82_00230 [Eubacterium sp.]|nr:hypothetical protein [Eubacterium sp.]